jgi:hypothetical protein
MSYSAERDEIMISNTEFEKEVTVLHLGSLADFGLGNAINGIPSELADASEEEKITYGEKLKGAVAEVTDVCHFGCIDGRFCTCNADGSQPEVRRRQVSGTGLALEVALNSNASILDTIEDKDNIGQVITVVEEYFEKATGVKRSAHLKGCGGLKGAVTDGRAIRDKPAIMNTVEAVMNIPAMKQHTGIEFTTDVAQGVGERAGQTSDWLEAHGWDAEAYVSGVVANEPAGVEDLEANDDEHHGHTEPAIVFFLSTGDKPKSLSEGLMKQLGINAPFVVNLDASYDMAEVFGGQQGQLGRAKALIANIGKHAAVGDRLASPKTPVYFMVA